MAQLRNKDSEEKKDSRYDFILPLEPHQLKMMWDEYTDGTKIINFRGKDGRLAPARSVYFTRQKIYSYDSFTGQFNSYVPEGTTHDDFAYKFEVGRRHWEQFETYARKREFAIKQDTPAPLIEETNQTEVKMMDFWQP